MMKNWGEGNCGVAYFRFIMIFFLLLLLGNSNRTHVIIFRSSYYFAREALLVYVAVMHIIIKGIIRRFMLRRELYDILAIPSYYQMYDEKT